MNFVTSIYTNLSGTEFNGNHNGIFQRYKGSIRSLALGGYDIYCAHSHDTFSELSNLLSDTPNVKLVKRELNEYECHQRVSAIRKNNSERYNKNDSWASRCVEIMWGKFELLEIVCKNMQDHEYVYWIDAGLFHGGLFPERLKSENSEADNPYDYDLISRNINLFEKLNEYTKDRILNIRCDMVGHGPDDYLKAFDSATWPSYGIIGGIFGGRIDKLKIYIREFKKYAEIALSKSVLLKEEEIMYYIHNQGIPGIEFTDYRFNTWYHPDWKDIWNPQEHIGFFQFFEEIIK